MRLPIVAVLLVLSASAMAADVRHQGYIRKDGSYVAPHYQTAPNNTNLDNYSTRGNVNPYTGRQGTVAPDYTPRQPRSNNSYDPPRRRSGSGY